MVARSGKWCQQLYVDVQLAPSRQGAWKNEDVSGCGINVAPLCSCTLYLVLILVNSSESSVGGCAGKGRQG